MISSKNIRFHSPSNTYIIPKNSVLDQNVAVNGNVIVGPGTRFWKNVKVDGNVQLGKGCIVEGHLKANQIIIGSRSKIKGNITADSDISLFQNVTVNSIESGGNITIMPGCSVGYANGNTLSVIGKAEIKKIGVITKVTVRANTVAELEDEPESESENKSENKSENIVSDSGFVVDQIDFSDSNDFQEISENFIFEDNKTDETKINSDNTYNNENKVGNEENLKSENTPTFPVEQTNETIQLDAETSANSEKSDAEIIDETDENSPKSFTVSEFSESSADRPITVPTDESAEVEIVTESDDSDSDSNADTVFQTVETPFGTIVVGEQPKSSGVNAANTPNSANNSVNNSANAASLKPSDNQFASVMESTRDEQQADFEAEMKIKSAPADRKSEFKWPAFEAKRMPKTEKKEAVSNPANVSNTAKTTASAGSNLFSRKISPKIDSQIEYDEIKIQTIPKQKESERERENFSNPKQTAFSGNANQKIIFEEVSGIESAKPQTIHKPKTKADLLMENMNFDTVAEKPAEAKLSAEKKVRTQEEIERSKAWYEERYPQQESGKKEYPPYV
ncbi:hypothetical protein [Methanimicrococcus blatticola]|uniref:Polymer-forming protein n=1 Tax=Methanimicrococcus blatticola TaxID=91560 RepID=A0A484F4X3_9EURY|nr:hypothetical protein [Methanimicrococcus blatticola]MBZ3936163.1 hypothetical protein [Methanimicrococcus blatticola]MCC2508406.1 hypothetical protein [Methanimicrococcus blatticola]TDQ70141.1 hypothetical protein C7391_0480 [Methanimicrococcus blatticola]